MQGAHNPMGTTDPFKLERFVQAQAAVYPTVLRAEVVTCWQQSHPVGLRRFPA